MNFLTTAPESARHLLESLYAGAVYRLPPTEASRRLLAASWAAIRVELGDDARHAQFSLTEAEFFERVGRLRKRMYTAAEFHDLAWAMIRSLGIDRDGQAFDPIRLRTIMHRGHENPRAAPIYHAHRDTWYAHSQAEITWWVPLHDVSEDETFVFYPDWFSRPVPNDSEAFDHDDWTANGQSLRIGWQNREHGRTHVYPGFVGETLPGEEIRFAATAGEVVLFAGAHFHRTLKQTTGRTRFSLDFRTVDLADDVAGRGAPNVDNRSRGSATRDYVRA